nr:LuxR C-terminal-related transcriptional regulator [Anoxybacillus tepidamans]
MYINELLQSVQEAYASLIGLPVVIVDRDQTQITSVSNAEEPYVFESKEIQYIMQKNWKDYLHFKSPALVDVAKAGIKGLIAPIVIKGQVQYLIWAGPFLATGWSGMMKADCEYFTEDVQAKLHILEKMASICARLIEEEKNKTSHLEQLKLLHRAVEFQMQQPFQLSSYLRMFHELHPYIHIAAYAERTNEGHFTIQHISSQTKEKDWLGAVYTVEHPIIKRLFQENRPLYLENVSTKYPFNDSQNKENELKTLILYPIVQDGSISGVIFVGSNEKVRFSEQVREVGHLLAKLMGTLSKDTHSYHEKNLIITEGLFSDTLTPREMDVLKCIVEGCSNSEIAQKLYISVNTVKNHITNIFHKLGVTDRSQLIAMVYQLNFEKMVFHNQ